jgi:urease gamma subunit
MADSIAELKRRAALLRRGIKINLEESSLATQRAMQQNRELAAVNELIEERRGVKADG